MDSIRILVVEDNDDDCMLVLRQFRKAGYTVDSQRVDTAAAMTAALSDGPWDVIVSDVSMPSFSGADALELWRRRGDDCPFLMVSGVIGEEMAVTLLKAGAHDFVLKGSLARLVPAFERERHEVVARRAHRMAQEALRQSEERYALAARGANDGLWDWHLGTGRVYYSPRWQQMVGAGYLGSSISEWFHRVHPDDEPLVHAALNDHLFGRSPHLAVEHRIRHGDGRYCWVLVRGVAVLDDKGGVCRIAGSLTDISAAKEAEAKLRRANEELERAIATKARFLAAASHDLRQPVQALFCFCTALKDALDGTPLAEMVDDVESSLEGLKALLDALLDTSRLDAGIIVPKVASFPVAEILDRLRSEMTPMVAAKGLTLRVLPSKCWVSSDPVLLGRILRNLAENAFRYTETGRVMIGCRRAGGAIRIEVWDTGIGIAEEHRDHIFEEFFQVANAERDRRKGLGLGLAIVSRLSRLLGHPVDMRSAAGRGSVFRVTVPMTGSVEAPARSMLPSAATGPAAVLGHLVLVIDDEVMVANALGHVLRAWGYEPIVAGSVDEAVLKVGDLPPSRVPSAIITDYRLGNGHTGTEAIERVRALVGARIPSVVVTGDTAVDRLRQVTASDAVVLHKPVIPADLREVLMSLMAVPA